MKTTALVLATTLAATAFAAQAETVKYVALPPAAGSMATAMPGGPPFSAAVMAGDTLYLSGTTDGGTALGGTGAEAARRVIENLKRTVEAGGLTMDDLVWVQIFCTDLSLYGDFNAIYRTYFKGPLPARAFIGTSQLLGGSRFEIMGVAVKKTK